MTTPTDTDRLAAIEQRLANIEATLSWIVQQVQGALGAMQQMSLIQGLNPFKKRDHG